MDNPSNGSLDRRSFFLRGLAGLGGAWLTSACAAEATPGAAAPSRAAAQPGVQLYTVRDRMAQDVAGTLERVAEIGYREVEFAGYHGWTPEQLRLLLDRLGLSAPAAHVPITEIRSDPARVLNAASTLGHRYVVVPWMDESERTAEGYRRMAADLNRLGAAARDRGMLAGYHNHDFEFAPLPGGGTGMEILLRETDPALVAMELDLYWAVRAGRDPVALFQAHPGRFHLAHVKDMADRAGEQRITEVGTGEIDFARIFAHAPQAGLRHFFVEHDRPTDSLASIRTSYAALRRLLS